MTITTMLGACAKNEPAKPAAANATTSATTAAPKPATVTKPAASPPAHPSAAPAGTDPASTTSVRGTRVRFGIAPGDYAADDGVMVGNVYDGTPAAKAGLKQGDRMVSWNGQAINSVEDWMPLLGAAKPGDQVKIVFYRGKDRIETTVTLVARDE